MADHIWVKRCGDNVLWCKNCYMQSDWPGADAPCSMPNGIPGTIINNKIWVYLDSIQACRGQLGKIIKEHHGKTDKDIWNTFTDGAQLMWYCRKIGVPHQYIEKVLKHHSNVLKAVIKSRKKFRQSTDVIRKELQDIRACIKNPNSKRYDPLMSNQKCGYTISPDVIRQYIPYSVIKASREKKEKERENA